MVFFKNFFQSSHEANQQPLWGHFFIFFVFVSLAVSARFLSLIPNWTWFGALFIWLGSIPFLNFKFKIAALYLSLVISDLVLGFYGGWWAVYLGHLFYLLLGTNLLSKNYFYLRLERPLMASFVFFLLSNLGVWLSGNLYPLTWEGLKNCFILALPFYKNTLSGDLFYFSLGGIFIRLLSTLRPFLLIQNK